MTCLYTEFTGFLEEGFKRLFTLNISKCLLHREIALHPMFLNEAVGMGNVTRMENAYL